MYEKNFHKAYRNTWMYFLMELIFPINRPSKKREIFISLIYLMNLMSFKYEILFLYMLVICKWHNYNDYNLFNLTLVEILGCILMELIFPQH